MKIRLTCVHHEALMIDCIVHDVPFPAYETFDHRQNLPRRFFLFFDKLFRAGRHNKELWSAAITRNKGRNNISFGTCIFEAHVRTTIQENYFAQWWMMSDQGFNTTTERRGMILIYQQNEPSNCSSRHTRKT